MEVSPEKMVGNCENGSLKAIFRLNKGLTLEKNENSPKTAKVISETGENNRRQRILGTFGL
jgi:hypothetical protein